MTLGMNRSLCFRREGYFTFNLTTQKSAVSFHSRHVEDAANCPNWRAQPNHRTTGDAPHCELRKSSTGGEASEESELNSRHPLLHTELKDPIHSSGTELINKNTSHQSPHLPQTELPIRPCDREPSITRRQLWPSSSN